MQFTSIHETILNSMSEAVYVVDRNVRIQYANPAAEKLTGHRIDDSMGKFCHDIFCEQSFRCADLCPPKLAMKKGQPLLHREAETTNRNGELRQTQISISPSYEGQECIGAVIVMKDITDLREAEDRIKRQNVFLRTVIDALPHPFSVIDAETYEVKLANNAASAGALAPGTTCHQLSHHLPQPCSGRDHPCPLGRIRETGKPVVVEHTHFDAGGGRDVEVHGYPIFDNGGVLVQMIEYCIDISDRKRAAQEREKLIADLQKALVEVKTLSGLLPICSSCKKIRDDEGSWNSLEHYISTHSEAEFSHGLCPECAHRMYPDFFNRK